MNLTMRWCLRLPAIVACTSLTAPSLRADLRLAERGTDLGEVRGGVRLSKEVALFNDSSSAVEIVEVRGSCGCVSPRIEPRVIRPKGKAALHLSINTLGEGAGPHAWKVAIRYREGENVKEIELPLRAKIITEITIQPASLTLITEGGLTQTLLLTDLRPVPMKIKQVAASANFLKARIAEQGSNTRTTTIQLEVSRELPPGRHVEALTIYADDPLYGELRVPVTIVRPAARTVTVEPPEVRLDPARDMPSQLVRIRSRDGQAVQIEKVQPAHDAIRCKSATGVNGDLLVKIEVDDALPPGVSRSRVEVHLSAPAREIIVIPVLIGMDER